MKKIMIAAVAIAFAAVAHAAAFNWSSSGTNSAKTFYGPDGATTLASGTVVYLLDSGISGNSQSDIVEGFRGGKTIADFTTVTSTTLDSNSRLTAKEFSYGSAGNDYNFYMVIVSGDNVFVSADKGAYGQASDTVNVLFTGIKGATQTLNADGAYASAGWYSTAAVPEPTSGLLMLLGMAGLALRRRRA